MGRARTYDMSEFAKLSVREKFLYGQEEIGGGIFFYIALTVSVFFYTDVIGVPAALVGTIFLVSRAFDAVTDIAVTSLVDRTRTKWGKARPWLIWMVAPYAFSMILMYMIPANATTFMQGLFIFITYNFAVTICFTAMNLPYGMLPSLMTRDEKQRSTAIIFRMTFSPIGGALGLGLTIPLVQLLGNDQGAWIKTMTIFAIVTIICNTLCFFNTRERVHIEQTKGGGDKVRTSLSVKASLTTPCWWIMLVLFVIYGFYLASSGTVMTYYCTYILGDTAFLSPVSMAQNFMTAAATVACAPLIRKLKKSTVIKIGMIMVIPAQLVLIFAAEPTVGMVVATNLVKGFGWGMFGGLIYALLTDSMEYCNWYSGVRSEGFTFAASGLGTKAGLAVGSGGLSVIMGLSGYDGTLAVQSAHATATINFLFCFLPLIIAVIALVFLLFYKVDRDYDRIMGDLLKGKFYEKARYANVSAEAKE